MNNIVTSGFDFYVYAITDFSLATLNPYLKLLYTINFTSYIKSIQTSNLANYKLSKSVGMNPTLDWLPLLLNHIYGKEIAEKLLKDPELL